MTAPFEGFWLDVRLSLRSMLRRRGQSLAATATLGIGIAIVTTAYSYLNSALFRPPPYANAARTVAITEEGKAGRFSAVSVSTIDAIRLGARSFDRVAAYRDQFLETQVAKRRGRLDITSVDSAMFALLGAQPEFGRLLSTDEFSNDAPVALVSDRVWRNAFASSDKILQEHVLIDGRSYSVIGVMPEGFNFPSTSDFWTPLRETRQGSSEDQRAIYSMLGRLRTGVSRTHARSELARIRQLLATADPSYYRGIALQIRDEMIQRTTLSWAPVLIIFLTTAGIVVLIACANVSTLMLMRAAERRGEMALRASLGATPWRVARHAAAGALLVVAIATALGAVFAEWLIHLTPQFVPLEGMPSWFKLGIDGRVLAFAFAVSAASVFAVGMAPARLGWALNLSYALRGIGDAGITSRHTLRHGQRGVVFQAALATLLLILTTLLGTTYANIAMVDPGFDRDHLLTVSLPPDSAAASGATLPTDRERQITANVQRVAGVIAAARRSTFARFRSADSTVGTAADEDIYALSDPGRTVTRGIWPPAGKFVISDDYFRTIAGRVVSGRAFGVADVAGAPHVAVLSQRMARLLWPREEALGKAFRIGTSGSPISVIGVVTDTHTPFPGPKGLTFSPAPDVFMSERQAEGGQPTVWIRTERDPRTLRRAISTEVERSMPEFVATWLQVFSETVSGGAEIRTLLRIGGTIIGANALTALLLAIVGVFAVVAYNVAQRSREFGIRMALGATSHQIRKRIMLEHARLVFSGIAIGIVCALAISPIIRFAVWGVSADSAAVYGIASALIAGSAWACCTIATRSIAQSDPAAALRES